MSLDEWIKPTPKKTEETEDSPYTLPVGSVSVYYREGEGFTYHYDARAYREHENPLLANLGILATIWNKLIDLGHSPRYLSKAYNDDIYAIVLSDVEKETDEYMEVDRLKIHISKHPLDARILDLSRFSPEIPDEIEKEMFDKGIDFQNPMLKFQELKSKLKSQEKEKPEQKTTRGECAKYSLDYTKQLIEKDLFIFDPRLQKIWDKDEFSQAYENNDWHTNSGHFNYVVQCWKKNGGSKEGLYDIILQNKDKHLHKLLEYWEKDLEQHIANTKDYAKSRNREYTEVWRQHSIDTWKELNLIREQLKLHPIPKPEILNLSTQEIISKLSSKIGLGKYTKNEDVEIESESTRKESPEEYTCEICGKKTDKLHKLRTGEYAEFFLDKKVCWNCYLRLHKEFYEKYGRCPICGVNVHLKEWPNFVCENDHILNVMDIEINGKKLFDDIYGKVSPEEYKKLYDKYFTIRDAIEEKYNKLVYCVQAVSVDKDYTGVEYDPVGYYSMKDLKNKIREAEKEGKIFAGLNVFFKDYSETWMNVNLVKMEKPEIIKRAEKNLKKATREYKKNNSVEEDYSTAQHTSLTEWTG